MSERKRVVVTGIGAMAPTGVGAAANWESLINGRSGIGPVTLIDTTKHKVSIAGEVRNLDATKYGFTAREAERYDRSVLLGVCAATEAVRDCGIDFKTRGMNDDVCVIFGTGIGGIINIENTCKIMFEQGPGRVTPFLVPSGTPEVTSHTIAMHHGIHGSTHGVNTACASGNDAIITAARRLMQGPEVVAITGGTEAAVCHISLGTFANMKALSSWDGDGDPTRVSRPFDLNRSGFVISEGSGALVLETLDHATARGARIYAEIVGCGQSTDAYHVTAPEPTGTYVALAIRRAMQDSHLRPEQIGYINAHGTSTKYNDLTETVAIKQVFGEHARNVWVSSTKSMTGHMIGGCGGVEAVVCMRVLETGIIPPTINYETPDPECDLDYVPNKARERKVDVVMSNNFGFGGHNAVVIFKRFGK
ncbi:MAG: beta-ketoacyl-ACP synthase II [Planctomycetaceae bacterium]|nr:beta-ketoacyl-ACP synthase II [Planctomycetaceae bacterium]